MSDTAVQEAEVQTQDTAEHDDGYNSILGPLDGETPEPAAEPEAKPDEADTTPAADETEGEGETGQEAEPEPEPAKAEEPSETQKLLDRIAQLEQKLDQAGQKPPEKAEPEPEPEPPKAMEFIDDDTLDAFSTGDKKAINDVLNKVYRQGIESANRMLPGLVDMRLSQIMQYQQQAAAAEQGYAARVKDITEKMDDEQRAAFWNMSKLQAESLRSANPKLTQEQLIAKTEEEVRKIFKVPKTAAKPKPEGGSEPETEKKKAGRPPAMHAGSNNRQTKKVDTRTASQQQYDDVLGPLDDLPGKPYAER